MLGMITSAVGFRFLSQIVVLTGAVLAGGSKLVHQIFGVYEAYTTAWSKAAQARGVASSS